MVEGKSLIQFKRNLIEQRVELLQCTEQYIPKYLARALVYRKIATLLTAIAPLQKGTEGEFNPLGRVEVPNDAHTTNTPSSEQIAAATEGEHATNKEKESLDTVLARILTQTERTYQNLRHSPLNVYCLAQELEAMKENVFAAGASFEYIPYAIAETGTLVLVAGKRSPRSLSLVPPVHIVWLRQENIVENFSVLLEKFENHALPSNLVLISGPSKTADIEMNLIHGIHGPREVIVILTHA